MSNSKPLASSYSPKIIAHRGGAHAAPENTFAAFKKAMNFPIDGLECDIQLTHDDQPVLFHDRHLGKLGFPDKRIEHFTLDQLQEMNMADLYDQPFEEQNILELKTFFEHFAGQTQLYLEVKSRPWDIESGHSQKLIHIICDQIESYKIPLEELYLMSFDPSLLKTAKQRTPTCSCIALFDLERPAQNWDPEFLGIGLWLDHLDHQAIDKAHQQGQRVLGYTCNTQEQLDLARQHQIDQLVTDNLDWLFNRLSES